MSAQPTTRSLSLSEAVVGFYDLTRLQGAVGANDHLQYMTTVGGMSLGRLPHLNTLGCP